MKIIQVLGHNPNWNTDTFLEQGIGDEFLISAFSFGDRYLSNKRIEPHIDLCMIDLQFYGKKTKISKGKLTDFDFHPSLDDSDDSTNLYITDCIIRGIRYQEKAGFSKIIIPLGYDADNWDDLQAIIKVINRYLVKNRKEGKKYYMTLPFSYDVIRNNELIDDILFTLTDREISFDGYFIVCENKPEQGRKLTTDLRLLNTLSTVFKTLKAQDFVTIYGYANWDALVYLAQTDIDYITIGTYENLRNFSIRRYTEDVSGGASDGFYFSEKLLNMIRAKDIVKIRDSGTGTLPLIRNKKNIFSDFILNEDYSWNIHKPDVNKNYLLSISKLLKQIASFKDIEERILFTLFLIEDAIRAYEELDNNFIVLGGSESQNYHLNIWKQHLLKTADIKPSEFNKMYQKRTA